MKKNLIKAWQIFRQKGEKLPVVETNAFFFKIPEHLGGLLVRGKENKRKNPSTGWVTWFLNEVKT